MAGPAVWVAACAAALPAAWWAVGRWLRAIGLARPNYRGDTIPVGFGLVTVLWSCAALASGLVLVHLPWPIVGPYLVAIGGFGPLGLADDIWGDRSATGLRGHLRALVAERRVTTGLAKAAGGLLLAACLAKWVAEGAPARIVVNALTISLAANAINLLDLRPGRASAVFLVLAGVLAGWLAASGHGPAAWPLAMVAVPASVVFAADRRARVMMGDVGSNPLGAVLGLTLAIAAPLWAVGFALAALVGLHVFAERYSLSRVIEDIALLRAIDRLTGVR